MTAKRLNFCIVQREASSNQCTLWHTPPISFLKCNVDAALFPTQNITHVGSSSVMIPMSLLRVTLFSFLEILVQIKGKQLGYWRHYPSYATWAWRMLLSSSTPNLWQIISTLMKSIFQNSIPLFIAVKAYFNKNLAFHFALLVDKQM